MPPKKTYSLLFVVSVIGFSCGGGGSFTGFHTRSVREYVEADVPSPSGVWGLFEYTRCYNALHKIAEDDFGSLPRLKTEKSRHVVLRMVSRKNIDQLKKESTANKETLRDFVKVYQQLLALYLGSDGKADYYHEEISSLLVFLIDYLDISFDSAYQQLSGENALPPNKMDGALLAIADVYEREITNLLEVQKSLNFSEDDLQKLGARIVMSVVMRKQMLPEDARRRIGYKMMEVKEVTIYRSIKDLYEDGAHKFE